MNGASIRAMESDSIYDFLEGHAGLFEKKRVLDYGCGRQPYRKLIEDSGGIYTGYDREGFPGNVSGEDVGGVIEGPFRLDVVVCTQVIQYVRNPPGIVLFLRRRLNVGGYLLMTYPTTWPEVETADLHRFTRSGMEMLLQGKFDVVEHRERAVVGYSGFELALGYGVVARAK